MIKLRSRLPLAVRVVILATLLAVVGPVVSSPSAVALPGDTVYFYAGHSNMPQARPNSPPKCGERGINLGAGTYRWGAGTYGYPGQLRVERTIYLGAAAYSWKVCIDQNTGPKGIHYVMYSELDPSYGPWRTVRMVSRGFELTPGVYNIYSFLDPIRLDA